MLCSTVGSGAVGTDNEEQTFAGLGAAAVGGPRLEAITAGGGFTRAGKKMAKEGVEEGNKDLQLNVVDALKKKRKIIASKRLMKTRNSWMSVTLCL